MNKIIESKKNNNVFNTKKDIRPKYFNDFIGQTKILENLKIFVVAANNRKEPLDHVILHGPPGLGKTTLAYIISNELKSNIKISSAQILYKPADIAGLLTNLETNDVLFIDEIHRLSPIVEEYLYSAMENYKIDILIESGINAKSIQININPFTLIGATTKIGSLTTSMISRFGINCYLEYYKNKSLINIIKNNSKILKTKINYEAANEIAKRSRGTPRIANFLLRRIRDFAEVKGNGFIDKKISILGLKNLNVDEHGLNKIDNKILMNIIYKYKGGPVGINTIAASVGENSETIEEFHEPFLIKKGFLIKTSRGRKTTLLAYNHLKLK